MTTNGRRTGVASCGRAAMLAAMWTALVWTCCVDAVTTAESNDWRPCRAAGHRRFDEDVRGNDDRGGAGYEDFTGGGSDDGETDADDDYNDDGDGGGSDEGYFRFPVDDKPKRGAVKQYEKKPDLHRPAASALYAADAALANGMRVDTTLLRGETVELPTYVNVPVTLKCRFEPVDGTVDKFDTVVEAMYPGHRDAPPPPPSSHAARILKQLMGSLEGWRGVTHSSGRTVRRASGNRYGRRGWPARDDEVGDGSPAMQRDNGYDPVAWDILAADRMRRIHDSRQDFQWPKWFHEQLLTRMLRQRIDGRPVAIRKQSEDQQVERDVYDHGVDDPQVAQVSEQRVDGRQAGQVDGQRAEQVYDQLDVDDPRIDGDYDQRVDGRQAEQGYERQVEPHIYDLQQVESVENSQQVESVDDSPRVEKFEDSQQVERFDESQQVEKSDDRAAAEEVDERRAEGGSVPVEDQQLHRDITATNAPETATAVVLDFAKFHKGIPARTYVEHAYTTDLAL